VSCSHRIVVLVTQAGLGAIEVPFLCFNCMAFGFGLVAVLLGNLLTDVGKIFFPNSIQQQSYCLLSICFE